MTNPGAIPVGTIVNTGKIPFFQGMDFGYNCPEPWERELIHNQVLLKRLESQFHRRKSYLKRHRIKARIQNCQARILAITFANS